MADSILKQSIGKVVTKVDEGGGYVTIVFDDGSGVSLHAVLASDNPFDLPTISQNSYKTSITDTPIKTATPLETQGDIVMCEVVIDTVKCFICGRNSDRQLDVNLNHLCSQCSIRSNLGKYS